MNMLRILATFFLLNLFNGIFASLHNLFPPSSTFHGVYKTSITANSLWDNRFQNKQYEKSAQVVCHVAVSRYHDNPDMIKVTYDKCDCSERTNCFGDSHQSKSNVFFVQLNEAHLVDRIYHHRSLSSTYVKNLYKGFISLLQVASLKSETVGPLTDSSGECMIRDVALRENCLVLRKTECQPFHHTHERPTIYEIFDVVHNHNSSYKICKDDKSRYEDLTGQETFVLYPTLQPNLAQVIKSKQHLNIIRWDPFSGTLATEFQVEDFIDTFLVTYSERQLEVDEESFRSMLDTVKQHLRPEQTATLDQVKHFYYLLDYIRLIRSEKILSEILQDDEYMDIQNQLHDLYVACGTLSCVQAILNKLNFTSDEHSDMQERILLGLSHLTPISKEIVTLYFDKVKQPLTKFKSAPVYHQAVVTLGSLLSNYLVTVPSAKYGALTLSIEQYLKRSYKKCPSEECKLAVIGAFESSQTPEAFNFLMKLMEASFTTAGKEKSQPISISLQTGIMKALKSMPLPSSPEDELKIETFIRNLLFDSHSSLDVSILSNVIDVAMRLDDHEDLLRDILVFLGHSSTLKPILKMKMDRIQLWCERQLLSSDICSSLLTEFGYQLFLQEPTKSTASQVLSGYFVNTSDLLTEFTLELVGLPSGLQKSSVMDISIIGQGGEAKLFSIYLYSSGLEAMVDADSSGKEDAETAGLLLNILQKPLRSIRFFEGKSGLMSAVWNAPSSLTPLLQSNLRLHDFQTTLHLQNGFVVDYKCQGVLSLDLSASISISLWTQTANALIRTAGAVFLESSLSFYNSHTPIYGSVSVSGASNVDFTTNLDINTKPVHICMNMERPDTKVVQSLHFTRPFERLQGIQERSYVQKPHVKSVTATTHYPGVSYHLGSRNSHYCRIMNEF